MRGQPVHRRSVLALVGGGAVSALAGCTDTTDGDATTTTPEPTPRSETQPTPTATDDIPIAGPSPDFGGLGLASNAFADGAAIPDRYTRSGADVNPPLSIAGVPEDAATLVLVVDDPTPSTPLARCGCIGWCGTSPPPEPGSRPPDAHGANGRHQRLR